MVGGAAAEEVPAAYDKSEEVVPAAGDAPAELMPAASAPAGATATVTVFDLNGLSAKVSALVDSNRAFSDKLDGISDVLSSATSKLETHGRAIECFGSTMGGRPTSVRSLKICLQTQLALPAGGGSGSEEDEEEAPGSDVVAIAGDVTAAKPDKPPAGQKVRRVGGGAPDVKSMSQHALVAKYAKAETDARVQGMEDMVETRRRLIDRFSVSISSACTAADVFRDSDTLTSLILECTMEHFTCEEAKADNFLSRIVNQPVKHRGWVLKDGSPPVSASSSSEETMADKFKAAPVPVRAGVPLRAVQPHLVDAIKKRVVAAFCRAICTPASGLTLLFALRCLSKLWYNKSDDGRKAIGVGAIAIYDYLGVTERIEEKGVGSGSIVTLSVGHYAMSSCFVRRLLDAVILRAQNKSAMRTGAEPGLYVRWRVELKRVHPFLEMDGEEHHGVIVIDGPDEHRALLKTSEDDMVEHVYNVQEEEQKDLESLRKRLELAAAQRLARLEALAQAAEGQAE